MRRALLLAVLAAPAIAAAQTTPADGEVIFSEGDDDTDFIRGDWISLAECQTAGAQVKLSWNTLLTNVPPSFPADAKYQVYASNTEVPAAETSCYVRDTGTDIKADAVTPTPLSGRREIVNLEPLDVTPFLAALDITGCSVAGDTPIYVCVQARDVNNATDIGIARGRLTLSIAAPGKPTGVSAIPADDGALEIRWSAPTGDPIAYDFRVTASSTDPRDPTPRQATEVRAQRYLMTGLVDDVPYTINVHSVSEAGNESVASDDVIATPVPVADFWDVYGAFGGAEQGGCGAGAASPLALVGLAALLAALRRRA